MSLDSKMITVLFWFLMLMSTTWASIVERRDGVLIPSDKRRGMSSCVCENYTCSSMSYSYSYGYIAKGGRMKKHGNDCYELCCNTTFVIAVKKSKSDKLPSKSKSKMSKGSKSKGSKSKKAQSKSKPKAKSSKGIAKPKSKPKPNYPSVSSMSYMYNPYVSECRCKKDFNDAMCDWCFTGNENCIDVACLAKCCYVQECKCDDHGADVCNRCVKGGRRNGSCPSEECTALCCTILKNSAYPASESNKNLQGNDYTSLSQWGNNDIPSASVTTITQSYPSTNDNASERYTEVSHGLFAVVEVGVVVGILAAVLGIIIRLRRNSSEASIDSSFPIAADYVFL